MAQNLVGRQINTPLARAFRQIVTAGWANLSDGNVEAPTGHFALVHIEPAEMRELMEAVFEDEPEPVTIYPGSYLVLEDSDGNTELLEYYVLDGALEAYNRNMREFALWGPQCPECDNDGPHGRSPVSNNRRCSCGHIWDPTEGVEVKREDMPFDSKFQRSEEPLDEQGNLLGNKYRRL